MSKWRHEEIPSCIQGKRSRMAQDARCCNDQSFPQGLHRIYHSRTRLRAAKEEWTLINKRHYPLQIDCMVIQRRYDNGCLVIWQWLLGYMTMVAWLYDNGCLVIWQWLLGYMTMVAWLCIIRVSIDTRCLFGSHQHISRFWLTHWPLGDLNVILKM